MTHVEAGARAVGRHSILRSRWTLFRLGAGIAIYGASIYLIARYLDANLSGKIVESLLSPAAILAVALFVAHRATMAHFWGRLLDDRSRPALNPRRVHYVYGLSLLARYVPGKILAAVVRIAQHRSLNREPGAIAASTLVELAIALTAAAIVGLTLIAWGPSPITRGAGGAALVIVFTACLLGPRIQRGLASQLGRRYPELTLFPDSLGVRSALAIGCVATCFAALGYGAFASTILPAAGIPALVHATGIYLIAGIAGTLAFIAPGGVGVREFAQYEGLAELGSGTTILALVIGARCLDIFADVLYSAFTFANHHLRSLRHGTADSAKRNTC